MRTEGRWELCAGLVAFCEATYDAELVCVETFQPKDRKIFCKGARVAITLFCKKEAKIQQDITCSR